MEKCPKCHKPSKWRWIVDHTSHYETLVCKECTIKENEKEWRSERWFLLFLILVIPISIIIRKIIGY